MPIDSLVPGFLYNNYRGDCYNLMHDVVANVRDIDGKTAIDGDYMKRIYFSLLSRYDGPVDKLQGLLSRGTSIRRIANHDLYRTSGSHTGRHRKLAQRIEEEAKKLTRFLIRKSVLLPVEGKMERYNRNTRKYIDHYLRLLAVKTGRQASVRTPSVRGR